MQSCHLFPLITAHISSKMHKLCLPNEMEEASERASVRGGESERKRDRGKLLYVYFMIVPSRGVKSFAYSKKCLATMKINTRYSARRGDAEEKEAKKIIKKEPLPLLNYKGG